MNKTMINLFQYLSISLNFIHTMQELKYFQIKVVPTEAKKNPNFASFNGYQKLTTNNKYHHDNPLNISKIFALSEYYPAYVQISSKEITFYDFYTHHSSKVLDDFMIAPTGDLSPHFGFFISPKAKEILTEYALPNHKYYPVNIIHKDITSPYYFLLIAIDNQPIIYNLSVFINRYQKTQPLTIDSFEKTLMRCFGNPYFPEIQESKKLRDDVREKKIILFNELDIYKEIFGIDFFFSENLKQRIEKEGLTGLEFKEQSKIEFYLENQA